MTDLEQIRSAIVRITHFIDAKRWTDLRALFADDVDVDYTALNGGAPSRQNADELVGGWHKMLAEIKTQHLLGPIDVEVTGTSAHAECHVRAHHGHKPGEPTSQPWVVMGHYVFELANSDRWRIRAMKLAMVQTV